MIKRLVVFLVLVILFLTIMKKPGNKYEISDSNKSSVSKKKETNLFISSANKDLKISHIRNIFAIPVEYRKKKDVLAPVIKTSNSSIRLEGVFLGTHKFAVINGKVYSVGDKVTGQEIIKIDIKKVTFKNGNILKVD